MQIIDCTLINAHAPRACLPTGKPALSADSCSREVLGSYIYNEVSTALDLTNLNCTLPDNINLKKSLAIKNQTNFN